MFKTMDPELVRKLIEGQEDILTPAAKAEEALYRNTRCPICGKGDCHKVVRQAKIILGENGESILEQSPFDNGPLPVGHARCIHCSTEFNPQTGMIFKTAASMIHGPE